jgi:hypothetical protein
MGNAWAVALLNVALLLATLDGQCAGAEIRVQGPADAVHLAARDATVAEILAALGEHYAVRHRGTPGTIGITATFEGPLRRVLVRVLAGNDYVIKRGSDGLEVIVLSRGSPAATSSAAPAPLVRQPDPFKRE